MAPYDSVERAPMQKTANMGIGQVHVALGLCFQIRLTGGTLECCDRVKGHIDIKENRKVPSGPYG